MYLDSPMTIHQTLSTLSGAMSLWKSASCGTSFGHTHNLCQFMCVIALPSLGNIALLQMSTTDANFCPTSLVMMPALWGRGGGIQTSHLDMSSLQCHCVCMSPRSLSITCLQSINILFPVWNDILFVFILLSLITQYYKLICKETL